MMSLFPFTTNKVSTNDLTEPDIVLKDSVYTYCIPKPFRGLSDKTKWQYEFINIYSNALELRNPDRQEEV